MPVNSIQELDIENCIIADDTMDKLCSGCPHIVKLSIKYERTKIYYSHYYQILCTCGISSFALYICLSKLKHLETITITQNKFFDTQENQLYPQKLKITNVSLIQCQNIERVQPIINSVRSLAPNTKFIITDGSRL